MDPKTMKYREKFLYKVMTGAVDEQMAKSKVLDVEIPKSQINPNLTGNNPEMMISVKLIDEIINEQICEQKE